MNVDGRFHLEFVENNPAWIARSDQGFEVYSCEKISQEDLVLSGSVGIGVVRLHVGLDD